MELGNFSNFVVKFQIFIFTISNSLDTDHMAPLTGSKLFENIIILYGFSTEGFQDERVKQEKG